MSRNQENSNTLSKAMLDLIAVAIAWTGSYVLRFHSGLSVPRGQPPAVLYFKLLPFIAVIWISAFLGTGFYNRSMFKRSAVKEALDIIQSSVVALLLFIAFSYFYEEYRYSRLTLMFFALLSPLALIIERSLVRKVERRLRRFAPPRNVLIIGGGGGLAAALRLARDSFATVAGVILVSDPQTEAKDRLAIVELGLKEWQTPGHWVECLHEHKIQGVYCGMSLSNGAYLEKHLATIGDQVPDIRILPDLGAFTRLATGVDLVDGMPVICLHESPLQGIGGMVKRGLDIIGALIALLIFAPVMLLISILVPLSSRGPILYRQERMGLDGRVFHCLKFRSMPMEAEAQGPVFASAGDQRATWLGRFLRRASLDELPQLLNVLKGDMSLVGPRPERPIFVGQFRGHIPGYMLRHKVKAGMTGWAQVNGWRGNTSIEKRIECDLYYIRNWSVWLDIKILFMTAKEVLFGRNAY